jgi:hypothetical protein
LRGSITVDRTDNATWRYLVQQPLDKGKALLYGQLVEAAYTMFKNPGADPLRPDPQGIPPDYELGAWIQMSDFILATKELKFYGFVAHERANQDSRVIAIRGTEGALEWVDDAAAVPVPFQQVPSAGRVALGFDKIYRTLKVVKRRLPGAPAVSAKAETETFMGSFAEQLDQLALSREAERGLAEPKTEGLARPVRPTVVTGHSLGAALATLFVLENHAKNKFDVTTLCTFASPRVGNLEFVHTFNQLPISSWRIVNTRDIVPKLPFQIPIVLDYEHVDVAYPFDSSDFVKNNPVCWHSIETYMHALDPASPLSPDCI